MSRSRWSVLLLAVLLLVGLALAPHDADAACCELRKIEDGASQTRVRACDPAEPAACATWFFDEVVSTTTPAEVCVDGDSLVYQEWNEAAESWSPRTQAVCRDGGAIDL